jgi:hypothetical protein
VELNGLSLVNALQFAWQRQRATIVPFPIPVRLYLSFTGHPADGRDIIYFCATV